MIESIKLLLGIPDDTKDGILKIMVEDAKAAITSYLNRKDFPPALDFAVRELVIRAYQAGQVGGVSQITRGDTSISYAAIDSSAFTEKMLRAFSKYKKVRME